MRKFGAEQNADPIVATPLFPAWRFISGIPVVVVTAILLLLTCEAQAHKFELGHASLSVDGDTYRIIVSADLIEVIEKHLDLRGGGYELIEQVRTLDEEAIGTSLNEIQQIIDEETRIRFDGRHAPLSALSFPSARTIREILDQPVAITEYRLVLTGYGNAPLDARNVSVRLAPLLSDVRLEITTPSIMLLQAGTSSPEVLLNGSGQTTLSVAVATFIAYTWQGIIHIVPDGWDHVLFVLCLFLISRTFLDLLKQVTIFTVAHTVTLTLGWLDLVSVPGEVVEPLIALSIVYVAVENVVRDKPRSSRLAVIFVFGLLHGLGFASVLREIGPLGEQWLPRALGFNIGIELGQLLIIAMAFLTVGWWRVRPWYWSRVVITASTVIAVIGFIWTAQRLVGVISEAANGS